MRDVTLKQQELARLHVLNNVLEYQIPIGQGAETLGGKVDGSFESVDVKMVVLVRLLGWRRGYSNDHKGVPLLLGIYLATPFLKSPSASSISSTRMNRVLTLYTESVLSTRPIRFPRLLTTAPPLIPGAAHASVCP